MAGSSAAVEMVTAGKEAARLAVKQVAGRAAAATAGVVVLVVAETGVELLEAAAVEVLLEGRAATAVKMAWRPTA